MPAAIAVAGGIGLGISSFENDLVGRAFGWRQVVSGLALVAATLGLLPAVAGAANGRWGLASSGVEQPLAFVNRGGAGARSAPCGWATPVPCRWAHGRWSPGSPTR